MTYWEKMTAKAIRLASEAMGKTFEISIDDEIKKDTGISGYIARQMDGATISGETEAEEILENYARKAFDCMSNSFTPEEAKKQAEKAYDILTDARNAMDDE